VVWLDSLWDAVHTAVRPIGGAVLALALVDSADPTWQVVTLLLGGGAALVSHGAKAGARAVVNASPEPFSNIAVSTGEDIVSASLLTLALAHPAVSIIVALLLLGTALLLILVVKRILGRLFTPEAPKPERAAP